MIFCSFKAVTETASKAKACREGRGDLYEGA
jgi:hypothetical protein